MMYPVALKPIPNLLLLCRLHHLAFHALWFFGKVSQWKISLYAYISKDNIVVLRVGEVAQWWSNYLACARHWIQYPA
jgi:hypothetical protein